MNGRLREKIDVFASNYDEVKSCFPWHGNIIKRLAALLYASEQKAVDKAALRRAYELIKRDTGVFSMFRGNNAVAVSALLAMSGDMDKKLSDALGFYDSLKKAGFHPSDYLVFAACQAIRLDGTGASMDAAIRAREYYEAMKKEHFFLTGREDYIYSVMLGLSGIPVQSGISRMERLYSSLKQDFSSKGGVQSLTQILVLGEDENSAAIRAVRLRDKLKAAGLRFDAHVLVPVLGVLSILPAQDDELVRDISSGCEYLRTQKGFGVWSASRRELLLFCASLTAGVYMREGEGTVMSSAVAAGLIDILLAQQAAVIAAVSSASATAAASSN